MKWRVLLAAACLTAGLAAQPAPLPQWEDGQFKKLTDDGWIAGATLLGEEIPAENPETKPSAPADLGVAQPTEEETAGDNEVSPEIPEALWATYFNKRPDTYLFDPQNLLAGSEANDRLAFLRDHAADSAIDLYTYVFRGDQVVPGEVREEELAERFFNTGKPAVILMYYLGAPQRSRLYLSPSIADSIPVTERQRALESSVQQAFRRVDFSGQFEAFLVQMSIRTYWMERMLKGEEKPSARAVTPATARHGAKPADSRDRLQKIMTRVAPFRLPLAGAGALLLLVGIWRISAKFRNGLLLPEIEVEPRLGGSHAAGVGAVIRFASRTVSPSAQRDAVPDYLRRM